MALFSTTTRPMRTTEAGGCSHLQRMVGVWRLVESRDLTKRRSLANRRQAHVVQFHVAALEWLRTYLKAD